MDVGPTGWVTSARTETVDDDRDSVTAAAVLDLEPCMAELAPRGEVFQPAWSTELMAGCWSSPSAERSWRRGTSTARRRDGETLEPRPDMEGHGARRRPPPRAGA